MRKVSICSSSAAAATWAPGIRAIMTFAAVPWIIRATWRSGTDYKPEPGYVTGIRKLIEFPAR